jgi:hypothetical protein
MNATGTRRAAAMDLLVIIGFFFLCYSSLPFMDPLLRRGHGLLTVFALAAYQFLFEGLAPLAIIAARRERFSDYGFTRRNLAKSLALAVILAAVYDAILSWHAGAALWIPMRRQPAVRMSLAAGFPAEFAGFAATVISWGFFEAFFGIFFARKLNCALAHHGAGWLSPGALGFALFNGLIHLTVGQGLVEGFLFSFASGYAIGVIPAVTGNAWGSALVQTLTDAVGKL